MTLRASGADRVYVLLQIPKNSQLWLLLRDIDPDSSERNGNWSPLSPSLKDLLNKMLDVDPRNRVSQICGCYT